MFFWNSLAFYDFTPKEVVSSLTTRHGGMDKAVYSGSVQFILLQSLSRVQLFATPWIAACQASLPSPTPRVYPNSCPLSQWCHPIISSSVVPFSSAFNLSQHQGLFKWVSSSHQVAKVLEFQLQSFQWTFRTDFLQDGLVGSPCRLRDSQESSPTSQSKSINSSVLSFFHSPTLTSIHDHWKNHSLD